jgi:hypothetical protein
LKDLEGEKDEINLDNRQSAEKAHEDHFDKKTTNESEKIKIDKPKTDDEHEGKIHPTNESKDSMNFGGLIALKK